VQVQSLVETDEDHNPDSHAVSESNDQVSNGDSPPGSSGDNESRPDSAAGQDKSDSEASQENSDSESNQDDNDDEKQMS
jgi:hypothetical protein